MIAIGVIGEGGVDDASGDRRDRMREGLAGRRIGIGAHIRLGEDVADHVIGDGLGQIQPDGRRGQAVEIVRGVNGSGNPVLASVLRVRLPIRS